MDFSGSWGSDGFMYGILSLSSLQKQNKNGDIGRRYIFIYLFGVAKHSDCSGRRNFSLPISGSVTADFVRTLFIYLSAPLHIFMS